MAVKLYINLSPFTVIDNNSKMQWAGHFNGTSSNLSSKNIYLFILI